MKCPTCSETLSAGAERCRGCGAIVGPPVEGALAPKPRTVTPPPRDQVEPLRDIPGLRKKKEPNWRDEVQERVRTRRKKRAQTGLPLFEQPAVLEASEEEALAAPEPTASEPTIPEPVTPEPPSAEAAPAAEPAADRVPALDPAPVLEPASHIAGPAFADRDFEAPPLSDEELADLPLRPDEPLPGDEDEDEASPEVPPVRVELFTGSSALDEELIASDEDDVDSGVSLTPPPAELSPLERPARVGERAQAAAVDAAILCVLGALVVYFTGRAARVDMLSLSASWPWLVSYLAFLGLFYAGYFTGTSGQTPGKMVTGLRVVDGRGRPPGYLRAAGRAAAAAVGTALAGLGLVPMVLDPARRAFHDRLLQTRVVHR